MRFWNKEFFRKRLQMMTNWVGICSNFQKSIRFVTLLFRYLIKITLKKSDFFEKWGQKTYFHNIFSLKIGSRWEKILRNRRKKWPMGISPRLFHSMKICPRSDGGGGAKREAAEGFLRGRIRPHFSDWNQPEFCAKGGALMI